MNQGQFRLQSHLIYLLHHAAHQTEHYSPMVIHIPFLILQSLLAFLSLRTFLQLFYRNLGRNLQTGV